MFALKIIVLLDGKEKVYCQFIFFILFELEYAIFTKSTPEWRISEETGLAPFLESS